MAMKKWIQVNELGTLYKECVLMHFDVPLLFVCKDKMNNRYLILCVNEEDGQYLCLQIPNDILLKMLKKEIAIVDAFKQPSSKEPFLISYDFSKEEFIGKHIS